MYYLFIYLYKIDLLNSFMFQNLSDYPSITTTNNNNLRWTWMGLHDNMGEHFMVKKFISFSELDNFIKDKHSPIIWIFYNHNLLKLALALIKDLFNII